MYTDKKFSFLTLGAACSIVQLCGCSGQAQKTVSNSNSRHKNVVFILSDDHRYDYMGFLGTVPWLQTPSMDRMAREGVYLENTFVTTSLSSPSRASILTSLFSHEHRVVDNQAPTPEGLAYFPSYLQQAGYQTAFFGKWHMGNTGWDPQPGFNHWEAFKGQGKYYANDMNVNGEVVTTDPKIYIAELLTDHALDFIEKNKENPFFVYLSHKSVHDPFVANEHECDMYVDEEVPVPASFGSSMRGVHKLPSKDKDGNPAMGEGWYGADRMPDWVKNQRESWHGVDYCYHNRTTFEEEARKYCETITSLDKTIGRVLKYLEESDLIDNTIVIYMGDNGFCWGEHGLIDKRTFYEASARVPLLVYAPGMISQGAVVKEMIQNIDIAPTILDYCGVEKAPQMRGLSFRSMLEGKDPECWRDQIFYEYYWEYDYPQTPTIFGVRSDRYKYIRNHGVWDTNEFYDLKNDPHETQNLIAAPEHQARIREMSSALYDWMEETDGMQIPIKRTVKFRDGDHRNSKIY